MDDRDLLRKIHARLLEKHNFKVGDVVRWKEGLKNRRMPAYGQAAIVLEVLDKPLVDEKETAGSAYFREPLDVLLSFTDGDNNMISFHFDSRKFEPFESKGKEEG
jgi:hypothetical protein